MFTPTILNSVVSADDMKNIMKVMNVSAEEEVSGGNLFIIEKKGISLPQIVQTTELREYFLHHVHLHDEFIYNAVYVPPNYL